MNDVYSILVEILGTPPEGSEGVVYVLGCLLLFHVFTTLIRLLSCLFGVNK